MPLFLDEQTLHEAVERLSISTAQSILADYLIFKRALKLTRDAVPVGDPRPDEVLTGLRSEHYVAAIEQFAVTIPPGVGTAPVDNPFYIPFGSKRDRTRGYRTHKYPSNGPSDTASRWQGKQIIPLVLVPNSTPMAFQIGQLPKQDLEEFFNVKTVKENCSGEKPGLIDSAVWWFRFSDLEIIFGGEPSITDLADKFAGDFELTTDELAALFDQKIPQLASVPVEPKAESEES